PGGRFNRSMSAPSGASRVDLSLIMRIRFYIDPVTDQPHIYEHDVTEDEIRQALLGGGDDFQSRKQSRIHVGQTKAGRYLKIMYVPDEDGDSVFVITASAIGR